MPQTETIKALLEKRASTYKEAMAILDVAEKRDARPGEHNEGQPRLTGEQTKRFKELTAEVDRLGEEIDTRKQADALEQRMNAPVGTADLLGGGRPANAGGNETAVTNDSYGEAFRSWLRRPYQGQIAPEKRAILDRVNNSDRAAIEFRDLGVGTGAAGGFMVPQGFLLKITEALKYYGPVRSVSNVIETASGQPLPWPGNDDTANVGAILAENTAITAQDVTITQKTLNAYMYTSLLVKVSWQLLNDDAFDVETFLARKLGQRIGRIQNTHFTVGTGSGQPQGFQTSAAVTQGFTLPTGNTTSLTYAGLVQTIHKVDYAYRQRFVPSQGPANLSTQGGPGSVGAGNTVGWQMNDATLAAVRSLVDSQNRPLWQLALNLNDPDTLLGYPVYVNPDIPVMAANAKSAFFGTWDAAYLIRDVAGVQMVRLDERFADQLQAGFFAFCRTDATVDDPKAIAYLQNSAT